MVQCTLSYAPRVRSYQVRVVLSVFRHLHARFVCRLLFLRLDLLLRLGLTLSTPPPAQALKNAVRLPTCSFLWRLPSARALPITSTGILSWLHWAPSASSPHYAHLRIIIIYTHSAPSQPPIKSGRASANSVVQVHHDASRWLSLHYLCLSRAHGCIAPVYVLWLSTSVTRAPLCRDSVLMGHRLLNPSGFCLYFRSPEHCIQVKIIFHDVPRRL